MTATLVVLGYVTRHAAENDGRGMYAQLTDSGVTAIEAARRTHARACASTFSII